jgi:hypothetical protein
VSYNPTTGEVLLPATNLARSVLQLCKGAANNDALQNELFNLLGFESFDLVAHILATRALLKRVRVGSLDDDVVLAAAAAAASSSSSSSSTAHHLVGASVTSESQKRRDKQTRKMLKRSTASKIDKSQVRPESRA